MKYTLLAFVLILSSVTFAKSADIQRLKWEDLDVVWLKDDRLPTYNLIFYFADGALSDKKGQEGLTNAALSLLDRGTNRFDQQQISENLEYFGVSYGANVTHEYSTYAVSGLVKDMVPTMKKICHLFADASYPKKEVRKEIKRASSGLQNLVNSHGSLANRIFREVSLSSTPYAFPVEGRLKSIKRLSQKRLKAKLDYLNKDVAKRVYISGPADVLKIKDIVTRECGWTGQGKFVRSMAKPSSKNNSKKIVFVPVPNANQAQVRIGRFLDKGEIQDRELLALTSGFLGGGFTSKLMREVRVKRGLTYSIGAFAAGQKEYGRAGISTFTKNQTIDELLEVIKLVLDEGKRGEFTDEEFSRARGHLAGSFPFGFEESGDYLSELMNLDHIGKDYDDLYDFPKKVRKLSKDDIKESIGQVFDWDNQTILILGSKSLLPKVKKFGKVKVVNYKKFL